LETVKKFTKSEGKKMLKKSRCLVLALILILVFVSCTTFAAKKPVTLIVGSVYPTDHFFVKSDLYFKKLVEKKSQGQIVVEYYPANQLGSLQEMYQATMTGAQHIAMGSGGSLASYWPKLGTLDLPYLYRNHDHYLKVASKLTSLLDQNEMVAKTGMRIIGVRIRLPRQLTTKFPVHKLDDIKGLKIRVPENPLMMNTWRALGTIPTVIPVSDVYTALATGTVDAQENPFDNIYTFKFYEQVKYCALTSHLRELELVVINNNFWNSLTAPHKKIIADAMDQNCKMINKAALEDEKKPKQLLAKNRMKFTNPDLPPFREKAKTIWSQFGDEKLIEKIEAVK
jgi:tripartite ATP-independent transporter DctP family solute receptor